MRTHNQNKLNKKLITGVLYTMIIAGAAGAATGTYAWYSYQKEVSVKFNGTAINKSTEIEVGLRVPTADIAKFETVKVFEGNTKSFKDLYKKDFDNDQIHVESVTVNSVANTVYWIRGNYIQEILTNFAKAYGSALDSLSPISAGYFSEGMNWQLGDDAADDAGKWSGFKRTPLPVEGKYDKDDFATVEDYFYLPLAFRVSDPAEDRAQEYKAGEKIYLTQFDVVDNSKLSTDSLDLADAIRCKVDFPNVANHVNDYIFNPSNDGDAENLAVGGALNLYRDTYFDYYYKDGDLGEKYEIAYGQFVDNNPTYIEAVEDADPTIELDDCDTFTANHLKGVKKVDMGSTGNFRKCQTRNNSVVDSTRTTSFITTDTNGYCYADLSIYIEGWDHNVVDYTAAHKFAISLEFGISK